MNQHERQEVEDIAEEYFRFKQKFETIKLSILAYVQTNNKLKPNVLAHTDISLKIHILGEEVKVIFTFLVDDKEKNVLGRILCKMVEGEEETKLFNVFISGDDSVSFDMLGTPQGILGYADHDRFGEKLLLEIASRIIEKKKIA